MSTELATYENLALTRAPKEVLDEAKKACDALIEVVSKKAKPVKFNNEVYLEFEDWQTVAKFYGCTVKVEKSVYVEFGNVVGFEAVAIVLDRTGQEISRAESMCLDDEENWGDVPKYEWVDRLDDKGKKIWDKTLRDGKGGYVRDKKEVGREPKPLFQLRSMAQTRACAKALRNVFSWVVVLAGYKPTVAEELSASQLNEGDPSGGEGQKAPGPDVQRKSAKGGGTKLPPIGQQAQGETVICSECRVSDGHAPTCKYNKDAKPAEASAEPVHGDAYEGPDNAGGEPVAQTDEQKAAARAEREKKWKEFAGHDPEKHISFAQGNLLFVVQGKVGISEDDMKAYMKRYLNVEHRPLIPKDAFTPLLDAIDPRFEHHKADGQK